jgi:superfamily I DNA/RNA helicase
MTAFLPSPQQSTIFDWVENGSGSAVIEAVAGAGKTTTLIESLKLTQGNVAFCAYNKAIAIEIGDRVKPLGLSDRVKTGTVHSFGNGILRASFPKTKLDAKKLNLIADQVTKKHYLKTFAVNAASMAKQVGIGIICPIGDTHAWVKMVDHYSIQDSLPKYAKLEEAIELAQRILEVSNKNCAKMIDFDDMVYVPVLLKLRAKQFDWVFLDEAQDTNAVRRELVKLILSPNGRLVAVGDSHQAIYGFTGADHEAMENICREFKATKLPLTTTYRCPKEVVKVANQWVNHIQAAESAPEVVVEFADLATLIKQSEFSPEDAILCRVTKPLVALAFRLISNGIPCKVEGRSIGKGLLKLIRKWKVSMVGELYNQIDKWYSAELASAMEHDSGARCEFIEDQAATLRILADQCNRDDDIQTLVDLIESLFGDTESGKGVKGGTLTLATIHRSKGREWNRVFVLGMDTYSPCKWAKQPWEMVQEANLCYVQVTRAKETLTFVGG